MSDQEKQIIMDVLARARATSAMRQIIVQIYNLSSFQHALATAKAWEMSQ